MNKIWDVVPANNFMTRMVAKMNYDLINLTIQPRKKIEVRFVESSNELGTQDGQSYQVSPIDDCSCEPNLTCYTHAGYFTEKH